MSCIRKLFSRKSLRSLSSETVLVTDQSGSAVPSTRGPEAARVGVGQHVDTESSCSDGNVVPRGRLPAAAAATAAQRPASKLTSGHIQSSPPPHIRSASTPSTQSAPASNTQYHVHTTSGPNAQSTSALSSQIPPGPSPNTQYRQAAPVLPLALHLQSAAASSKKQTHEVATSHTTTSPDSRAPPHHAPGTASTPNVPSSKGGPRPLHQTASAAATVAVAAAASTAATGGGGVAPCSVDFCSRSASCSFASLRRSVKKIRKEEAAVAEPRVAHKQTCVVSPSVVDNNARRVDSAPNTPSPRNETRYVDEDFAGEDNHKTDSSTTSDAGGRNTDTTNPAVEEKELAEAGSELSRVQSSTGPDSARQRSETSAAPKLERNASDVNPRALLPASQLPCAETHDRLLHSAKASASDPPAVLTIRRRDSCSNLDVCELPQLSPQRRGTSFEACVEGSARESAGTTPDADGGLGSAAYEQWSWGDKEQCGGAKDSSRLRVFTAHSAVVAYTYGAPREDVAIPLNQNLSEGESSPTTCLPHGGATAVTASSTESPTRPSHGNNIVVSASLPAANLQAQQQRNNSTVSCNDDPAAGNHQNSSDSRRHSPAVDNLLNSSVSRRGNSAIANLQNSPVYHNNLVAVSNHGNGSFSDHSSATTDQETNSVSHNNSTISSRENNPASRQSLTANGHQQHGPVYPNNSVIASQQSSTSDSDGDHSSTAGHSGTECTDNTNTQVLEDSHANSDHAGHPVETEIEIQPAIANTQSVEPYESQGVDPSALEAHSSGEYDQGFTPDSSGSSQAEIGPSENIRMGGSLEVEDDQIEVVIERADSTVSESMNATYDLVQDQSGPSCAQAATPHHAARRSPPRSSSHSDHVKPVLKSSLVMADKQSPSRDVNSLAFANEEEIRDNLEVLNEAGESSHLNVMSFQASDFSVSFVEHLVDQIKQQGDVDGQSAMGSSSMRNTAGRAAEGKGGGIASGGSPRASMAAGSQAGKNSDLEEAEEDDDVDDDDDTVTTGGLLDVFQLDQLSRANRTQLNSSYKRLRKDQKKIAILQQYLVHQAREQAELSRLIKVAEDQNSAMKLEKKDKESELQKICDHMEFEDEAVARKHEPLMYKKYCAAKTNAEAKTLLSTIRHRQRALHFLEAMAYRKCVALEHNLKIEMEEPEEKTSKQKKKCEKLKLLNQGASPTKKPRKNKDLVSLCAVTPSNTSALVPLTSPMGPPSAGSASTGTVALPSQQLEQTDGQQGQAGHVTVFGWPSVGSLAFDEVFETEV